MPALQRSSEARDYKFARLGGNPTRSGTANRLDHGSVEACFRKTDDQ